MRRASAGPTDCQSVCNASTGSTGTVSKKNSRLGIALSEGKNDTHLKHSKLATDRALERPVRRIADTGVTSRT